MPLVVMEDRSSMGEARRPGRLENIQNNVRTMLLEVGTPGSSLYSRSPNAQQTPNPNANGPKSPPARGLFGLMPRTGDTPVIGPTPNFHLPLNARGNASIYSPATAPSEWMREPLQPSPTAQTSFRHPADTAPIIDESERDLEAGSPPRIKKSRRKHRTRKQGIWTRKRKTQSGSRTCAALLQGKARAKLVAVVISGLFLASVLTIYLSIALTMKNLSQQIHILFILTILATTIFFTHSLVRLIVLTVRPNKRQRTRRPAIPEVVGPGGFKPDVPIRVAMARDEELASVEEDDSIGDEKLEALKQPPPAYGLWRCSVRIDPNLLHWQRANGLASPEVQERSPTTSERRASPAASPVLEPIGEAETTARRPPSYVSEDGVSYVVSALPGRPPSEIHPALRIRLP